MQDACGMGGALLPATKAWVDNPGSWVLQLLAKIKPVIVPTETQCSVLMARLKA